MVKVKTQPVIGHQRTSLMELFAQCLPQSTVQQMGSGVISGYGLAALCINSYLNGIAGSQSTFLNSKLMND